MSVPQAPAVHRAAVAAAAHNDLTIAAPFESALPANGLDSLDALMAAEGERLDKPGLDPWRQRLRIRVEDRDGPKTFFLKRYQSPPRRALREMRRSGSGGRSLAEHEWIWMCRLAEDGIAAVQPAAFGHELCGRRERRSAILAAEVPGRSLEAWAQQWGAGDRAVIRSLIAPLAELVRWFHDYGYIHRDLYLAHIFYDPNGPVEEGFHLIDLQRVIRPRVLRHRWIVKDLAALNFSTPSHLVRTVDRLRWLKRYLGTPKLGARERRLVYRVIGKTAAMTRHDQSRIARLHEVRAGVAASLR